MTATVEGLRKDYVKKLKKLVDLYSAAAHGGNPDIKPAEAARVFVSLKKEVFSDEMEDEGEDVMKMPTELALEFREFLKHREAFNEFLKTRKVAE